MLNKRAQIAETMTWVVATIIIMVILAIAIYAASAMSQINRTVTSKADDSSVLIKKSLQGYLLTNDSKGESVYSKLDKTGDLDILSEELGNKVFIDPYNQFTFSLELNPWNLFKSSYKKIKINDANKLEVFRDDETMASI